MPAGDVMAREGFEILRGTGVMVDVGPHHLRDRPNPGEEGDDLSAETEREKSGNHLGLAGEGLGFMVPDGDHDISVIDEEGSWSLGRVDALNVGDLGAARGQSAGELNGDDKVLQDELDLTEVSLTLRQRQTGRRGALLGRYQSLPLTPARG